MQLIADRFVVEADGRTWDLATGERVTLTMSTAGAPADQASWAERCAWLSRVSQASLAPLVDYGVIGAATRFEAWGATLPWTGARAPADLARRAVHDFLVGSLRLPLVDAETGVADAAGRAVVIPDDMAGRVAPEPKPATRVERLDRCGRMHGPDPRLAPVFELLESQQDAPSAIGVWASSTSETGHIVRQLARAARLGGRVPVDARLIGTALRRVVGERSLLIIARDDVDGAWRALINAATDAPRRHVACFIGERVVRRVYMVSASRPTPEGLAASVVPSAIAGRHARQIATAARRARGSEARFHRILFGVEPQVVPGRRVGTAAEQGRRVAEEMSADAPAGPLFLQSRGERPGARAWPAPGEVLRLRKQAAQVATLFSVGRHGPGERLARHVMHALARRAEWADALDTALVLARGLRRRGLSTRALDVLDAAREWESQACSLAHTLELARARAELLIDGGQLVQAEAILEPARAAADSQEHPLATALLVEHVRCLHWQGRDTEALHRLAPAVSDSGIDPGSAAVRLLMMRSVVAMAGARIGEAVALAARARDSAMALTDAGILAEALERCAEVQLVAGDAAGARAIVGGALPHARRAHAPLLAIRLRLLKAEAGRRLGQRADAAACLARYGGMTRHELPFLVRARLSLLRALLDAPDPAVVTSAQVEASGLAGLRHYGPAPSPPVGASSATPDDLVALLQCCHTASDDRAVLLAVCARLRGRLAAAGVGFAMEEGGQFVVVSADGRRPDPTQAARAAAMRQLVWHDAGGGRAEAALPVRFADDVVGVLVAVWPPGAGLHAPDAALLLSTGAAAAGPALAGVKRERSTDRRGRTAELLGVSVAATDIREAIERAAPAPFPVLVEGESGVGKELVARLLHKLGPRRDRACATMNCAALPDELVESELFGHARGAFTGAVGDRRGLFEEAHGGTLFLDEVGELSLRAQAKLLRAIQDGEIRRVGENTSRRVDVRLIAATNRNLRSEADAGRFRLDLLYRLDVLRVTIPPLRARPDDVPVLTAHLWRDATARLGSQAVLAPATIEALTRYQWPGNVRELQNVLAALAVRAGRRGVVQQTSLPPCFADEHGRRPLRLEQAREGFDRAFIRAALVRTGGRRTRAARELGVSRQGLAKLMLRLAITDADGQEVTGA